MVDWRNMAEIQGVDLNDSWVLSWAETEDELVFQIEASLLPGHVEYTEPREGEWTCYKRATLSFIGKKRADGLRPMAEVSPTTDPDGSVDYGCIDALQRNDDGSYLLCGDFGDVTIESDGLTLHLS
jgi:hypothetical protein